VSSSMRLLTTTRTVVITRERRAPFARLGPAPPSSPSPWMLVRPRWMPAGQDSLQVVAVALSMAPPLTVALALVAAAVAAAAAVVVVVVHLPQACPPLRDRILSRRQQEFPPQRRQPVLAHHDASSTWAQKRQNFSLPRYWPTRPGSRTVSPLMTKRPWRCCRRTPH
jgi:hypothetical protein